MARLAPKSAIGRNYSEAYWSRFEYKDSGAFFKHAEISHVLDDAAGIKYQAKRLIITAVSQNEDKL